MLVRYNVTVMTGKAVTGLICWWLVQNNLAARGIVLPQLYIMLYVCIDHVIVYIVVLNVSIENLMVHVCIDPVMVYTVMLHICVDYLMMYAAMLNVCIDHMMMSAVDRLIMNSFQ